MKLNNSEYRTKVKSKRPGIHSKNAVSNNKKSKLYKKRYKGQGR